MPLKLVIVGGGPGGYVAAVHAAHGGAEVTLVEKEALGGTCLHWGCIPTKIFRHSADLLEKIQKSDEFGITGVGRVEADLVKLQARKEKIIQAQLAGLEQLMAKNKIQVMRGTGSISGKGRLMITTPDRKKSEIKWDKLILATGSSPMELPGLPFNNTNIVTSSELLALDTVPKSAVIVGGGVIGCEFANILNAFGAQVTIIEGLGRLLPIPCVDESCSKTLLREMKKKKIDTAVNSTVTDIRRNGSLLTISTGPSPWADENSTIQPGEITADMVMVSIGRAPATDGLQLETMQIKTDKKGWIEVDATLQTSHPDVYAIGDVLGPGHVMLAHVASAEARIAAANALGENKVMDYSAVPSAIFTMPEIGCVGLTEREAEEKGLSFRSDSVLFRVIGKAQVIGEIAGEAKIVSEEKTGRVLGAHIIGPHATDLIAECTLAIKVGATLHDLAETIHAHPTLAEVIMEVAHKAVYT